MGGGNFNWNGKLTRFGQVLNKKTETDQSNLLNYFGFSPFRRRLAGPWALEHLPYLPPAWNAHARTLYLQALRDAVAISRIPVRSSPPRGSKKQKVAPSGGMLFRGAELKALASESPGPASPTENLSVDPVLDELRRWDGMGVKEYEKFISTDGLLNEFAMMWSIREAFPLHHIVFKQTASHLAHEAFVEQIFSRAGLLSDPNLDPAHLVTLVKVGFNKAACNPPIAAIMDKYYEMFRGHSKAKDEAAVGEAGCSSAPVMDANDD